MKNVIKIISIICVLTLSACSNKAALRDSSNADYKTAKEAPELILPDSAEKKTKRY